MLYKILDPDQWSKLESIIPAEYLPRPEVAAAAVAEHEANGQIVGVLFLQLGLRLEPLVIQDSHVNFKRLADLLHQALASQPGLRYSAIATTPQVEKMCELAGMTKVQGTVFEREV